MAKRGRLEIIRDILKLIKENRKGIKITPLLRRSGLSSKRFYEYLREMKMKGFVVQSENVRIAEKGEKYLDKYEVIVGFIEEFEL